MDNSIKAIPIAGLTPINTGPPIEFKREIPGIAKPDPEHLRLAKEAAQTPVNTIFKVGERIVGAVSDGGGTIFYSASDAGDNARLYSATEHEIRLREKYGASLEVVNYPLGEGPASADLNRYVGGNNYTGIDLKI